MRCLIFTCVLALFTACVGTAASIEVFFSPGGGCTETVVREISRAKRGIVVQAYSFTSAPIADALVEASRRQVAVTVLLDKSQRTERYSLANYLRKSGVRTRIDSKHTIAHNKVIVIDGETVLTGSFNFTAAAEKSNAENLLVIHDPEVARQYEVNWKSHHDHSESYSGSSFLPQGRRRSPGR